MSAQVVGEAYDVDFGKLGADGLRRMLTFPGFALRGPAGSTYTVFRQVPTECIVHRLVVAPAARDQTSLQLAVYRNRHRIYSLGPVRTEQPRALTLDLALSIGDMVELEVTDERGRPGYWSNLAGRRWFRIFGAALVLDQLTRWLP